ncbi:MAG: hypothetical protein VX642_07645 [Bdellovibrionota bacterium]|nr:hypothetical protein [Bdellovibrionota bacterium]
MTLRKIQVVVGILASFGLLLISYTNCSGLNGLSYAEKSFMSSSLEKVNFQSSLQSKSDLLDLIVDHLYNVSPDRHLAISFVHKNDSGYMPPSRSIAEDASAQMLSLWFLQRNVDLKEAVEPSSLLVNKFNNGKSYFKLNFSAQDILNESKLILSESGITKSNLPNSVSDRIAVSYVKASGPIRLSNTSSCKFGVKSNGSGNYLCYLVNLVVPVQKVSGGSILKSYLIGMDLQFVVAAKIERSLPGEALGESKLVVNPSIKSMYALMDSNSAVVQGALPGLSENGLLLTYNIVRDNKISNVLRSRIVLKNNLSDSLSKEFKISQIFNDSSRELFCGETSFCEKNKILADQMPVLKSPIYFYDEKQLYSGEDFYCKNAIWGEASEYLQCLVSPSNNYWASIGPHNLNRVSISEPKLSANQNKLRAWMRPFAGKLLSRNYHVYFNMQPSIAKNVSSKSEYVVRNDSYDMAALSGENCKYAASSWNRYSQKNPNMLTREGSGSYIHFNFKEKALTSSSSCAIPSIYVKNFGFHSKFFIEGAPQGIYSLFQNNDFLVTYFERASDIKFIVRLGWGANKKEYSFPVSASLRNSWNDIEIKLFKNNIHMLLNGEIIGKQKLESNRTIKLNGNMKLGMSFVSGDAQNVNMRIENIGLYEISEMDSATRCYSNDQKGESIKLMAIGDSITEGKKSYGGTWRQQLCDHFRGTNKKIDFVGRNKAVKSLGSCSSAGQRYCDFDIDHEGYSGQPSAGVRNLLSSKINDVNDEKDVLIWDPRNPGQKIVYSDAYQESPVVDIALIHLGTNDVRIHCKNKVCQSFEKANKVSVDITKNTEYIVNELLKRNPAIKVYVAHIIQSSPAHPVEQGRDSKGNMSFEKGISYFYTLHRENMEAWASSFNLRAGRKVIRMVDQEKAIEKHLPNYFSFDTHFLRRLYHDTLHPMGPLLDSQDENHSELKESDVFGTEIMAEAWLEAILKD